MLLPKFIVVRLISLSFETDEWKNRSSIGNLIILEKAKNPEDPEILSTDDLSFDQDISIIAESKVKLLKAINVLEMRSLKSLKNEINGNYVNIHGRKIEEILCYAKTSQILSDAEFKTLDNDMVIFI